MKYLVLCFLLIVSTSAFAVESPEFLKCKDWRFPKISKDLMVIETTAVFYNPNKRGRLKLRGIDLDLYAGETYLGNIDHSERKVRIRPQSAFEIPLRISVEPKAGTGSFFNGLFSLVSGQNMVFFIKGHIKLAAFLIPFKVQVDEEQEFSVKDLF